MRIKEKLYQQRRDFRAIYGCEYCGREVQDCGYDDAYFHQHVIPAMTCPDCGLASGSASSSPDAPEGVVL